MKTKIKVFRWNEVKNVSEIVVTYFDNSKNINYSDIDIERILKQTSKKELI